MFKDLCRTVHLAQDDDHLFVDELLELSQVAGHVHFQLGSDLCITEKRAETFRAMKTKTSRVADLKPLYLFAGDILQVFLHHDLSQSRFDLSLCQLSFCWTAEEAARKQTSITISTQVNAAEGLNWDTYTSEKSRGESARCDCTSCMAFHSLMRTWSEDTLL